MPLSLIRQDITHLHVDAIVNAANESLRAGGGVCGAIFAAAGHADLQRACDEIGHVDTGSAVATPGFALPARHVIHTAGPVWRGGNHGERILLASCYRSSLRLAVELGDTSIAFPLISAGIYGYPAAEALAVAVSEIRLFLAEQPDMEVTLCLFDRTATTLTQGLFGAIEHYIDDRYVEENPFARNRETEMPNPMYGSAAPMASESYVEPSYAMPEAGFSVASAPEPRKKRKVFPLADWAFGKHEDEASTLEDLLNNLDAPFPTTLMAMIDERGLTDAQVYARANLSRQYFSKLRSGKINPSKRVVLSLAVALELPLEETRLLLERAGHALTHASKSDIIVEWFITQGNYDIFDINQALFAFDQPLLGSS